jgi:hypothetical protein
MADEIDITPRAVGEVMWNSFHIFNREPVGGALQGAVTWP